MKKKKQSHLSPEAAKILEQYRNAGKHNAPAQEDGAAPEGDAAPKPAAPTAPPANPAIRQRSGVRGK
jgi:hypothetical protein